MEELKAQILDLPTISVKIENVEVNNAVKGDYIPTPETAEIGQTVVVKSVDENGKPTEWEAADFPEGEVSWNDITDKPFGESEQLAEIATGQINDSSNQNSFGYCSVSLVTNGNRLVVGERYKVVVTTHSVEEYEFIATGSESQRTLGTRGEGQVYVHDLAPMGGMTAYVKPFGDSACNVSVYHITGELKTLPAEYLPEIPIEKLPEDIGDKVSWKNIKDKPFGDGGFEWKLIVSGSKLGSATNVTSLSVIMGAAFVPTLGTTYKVTVSDMSGATKEFTGVGNGPINGFYRIGTPSDDIYASASPLQAGSLTIIFKEPYSASVGVVVNVYEGIETIKPVPADWLPETVVMEEDLEAKGYQTEEQVNALINEALGVIENGAY